MRPSAACRPDSPRARFVGCTGKRVVVEPPVRTGKLCKSRKVRVCVTRYVHPCRLRYLVCPKVDRVNRFKTLRCSVERTCPSGYFSGRSPSCSHVCKTVSVARAVRKRQGSTVAQMPHTLEV